mgnify:CR=1 FL=1
MPPAESGPNEGREGKATPLYRQVRDSIAQDIRDRRLPPHTQYLSESAAMAKYGVSRVTVRQAFRLLEQEALLYRTQGKGTYIAPPPVAAAKTVAFMAACVLRSGVETIMLRSIEDYFDHRDINVIICNHDDNLARAERYIRRLVQLGVDGIIYMAAASDMNDYERNGELVRHIMDNGIPCVQIDRYVEALEGKAPSVRPDNRGGSKALTRHLLSLGHRHIVFLGNSDSSAVRDRREGCREALAEAGLSLPAGHDFTVLAPRDFRTIAFQISTMRPQPTAVVCVSDNAAFRLIGELRGVGMEVPRDIAVTGFDDYTHLGDPASGLTTVRVGHWEEGRIAASLMADWLGGAPAEPRPYLLPVDLIVRTSCGAEILAKPKATSREQPALLARMA